MSKIQQDFFVAVRAGSGDPALQSGGPCSSRLPDREHVRIDAFGDTDGGEGQALALR